MISTVLVESASAQVQNNSYNLMLKMMLSSKTPAASIEEAAKHFSSYTFLDARELEEYEVSHVSGARYVGSKHFSIDNIGNLSKSEKIIVYCSVGKRSEDVTLKLKKAGYKNVYNLYGGIFEWMNEGHSVVDSDGKPTTRVHAFSRMWGRWLQKGEKVY